MTYRYWYVSIDISKSSHALKIMRFLDPGSARYPDGSLSLFLEFDLVMGSCEG